MTTNPHLETSSLPGMPTITLAMRDCDAGLEDLRARPPVAAPAPRPPAPRTQKKFRRPPTSLGRARPSTPPRTAMPSSCKVHCWHRVHSRTNRLYLLCCRCGATTYRRPDRPIGHHV